ncbi:MAG: hypothetical protein RLZZ165_1847 [Bacteroidota bacterium]|jgi:hypothetical protein
MKKRFSTIQIVYLIVATMMVGGFLFTQARGIRLMNAFSSGLKAHSGPGSPQHK